MKHIGKRRRRKKVEVDRSIQWVGIILIIYMGRRIYVQICNLRTKSPSDFWHLLLGILRPLYECPDKSSTNNRWQNHDGLLLSPLGLLLMMVLVHQAAFRALCAML